MSEIIFQITEADTWEELRANVREAVLCHFDEGALLVISLSAGLVRIAASRWKWC